MNEVGVLAVRAHVGDGAGFFGPHIFIVLQINAALLELIPAPVLVVISIIAAIALVVYSITWLPKIIAKWTLVAGCAWTSSFFSFLGCLWTAFWTLVETIVWVLSLVAAVLLVLINIAALISVL